MGIVYDERTFIFVIDHKNMKHLAFLLLLISSLTFSQTNVTAFQAGEKLTFTASYNMSGLMTDLAQLNMEVNEVKTSKSTLWQLKCTARTYSKWDNFFKIRDLYESYVSTKSLTPYLYQRNINEGTYFKLVKYTFNHKTKTVKTLITKKARVGGTYDQKKNISINSGTRDLVTTLYQIRNSNLSNLNIGDSKSYTILFDREEKNVRIKLLGKETINTNIGKKDCYKLAISVSNSDVLKGNNDNIIWLTADANKIPVYAKFKVAVGSGELKIKSATGLKN